MSTQVRVPATKTNPCKVCGGYKELPSGTGDRCAGFQRGQYVYCSRKNHAGAARLVETTTPRTWKHKIEGCTCGVEHTSSTNGRVTPLQNGRTLGDIADLSPLEWWAAYTGVDRDEWEILGCDEDDEYVYFDFPGVDGRKTRRKGTKIISWEGIDRPPIWPLPEETLPKNIAITEGESDCGVARYCGFHAFTTTKGADGTGEGGLDGQIMRDFRERGSEHVTVFSDAGTAGREYRDQVVAHAHAAGLACSWVDLSPYYDLTRVRKDARSVFLHYGREGFLQIVKEQLREVAPPRPTVDRLDDLFTWADEDIDWLIEGLIARGTKTVIAAPTKSLKTWLTVHMTACCATCSPLLAVPEWAIPNPVRVLLIEEEGQRQMFGRRVRKVFNGITAPVQEEPLFRFRRASNLLDYAQGTDLIEILDRERIDLLIMGPLQRITPGVDENSTAEMKRVWDAVNRITLERPHVAVVVVAHNRKGDSLTWDSVRGAGLTGGEQDLGIFLRKDEGAIRGDGSYRGTLALALDGRELPQEFTKEGGAMEVEYVFDYDEDTFAMQATGSRVTVRGATPKKQGENNVTAVYEAVCDLFASTSQGVSKYEVADATGFGLRTVEKHLAMLTEQNRLARKEQKQEKGGAKAVWEVVRGE